MDGGSNGQVCRVCISERESHRLVPLITHSVSKLAIVQVPPWASLPMASAVVSLTHFWVFFGDHGGIEYACSAGRLLVLTEIQYLFNLCPGI